MGKKTAEKIIVELRDRVIAPVGGGAVDSSPIVHIESGDEDAVVALISLGFNRSESERAVSKAKAGGAKDIEEIIRQALKGM